MIKRLTSRIDLPVSLSQQVALQFEEYLQGSPLTASPLNVGVALALEGPVDHSSLQQAINQTVQRHEALRTKFSALQAPTIDRSAYVPGVYGQSVIEVDHVELATKSLRSIQMEPLDEQLGKIFFEDLAKPFDYQRPPILRATLLEITKARHFLMITSHHLIFDSWSVRILIRDLTGFYSSNLSKCDCSLPVLSIHFPDFAVWQRQQLNSESFSASVAFWRAKEQAILEAQERHGELRVRSLSKNSRPRSRYSQPAGATHHAARLPIPSMLLSESESFARRNRVTPFMLWLTALLILLQRLTQKRVLIVRTPFANRSMQTEHVIGWFANSHFLAVEIETLDSAARILEKVSVAVLEAYTHQSLPSTLIHRASGSPLVMAEAPMFFHFAVNPNLDLRNKNETNLIKIEKVLLPGVHAVGGMHVSVDPYQGIIAAGYRKPTFAGLPVATLTEALQRTLAEVISFPQRKISDFIPGVC